MSRQLTMALRYITKAPATQAIKLTSLTLGLAAGLIIMAKVTFDGSQNDFLPDRDRVWLVTAVFPMEDGSEGVDEGPQTLGPMAKMFADNVPAVEAATRTFNGAGVQQFLRGEEFFGWRTVFADERLFDVLDYGLVSGSAEALAQPDAMLVSQTAAAAMFPEADPIGKQLTLGANVLTIRGVFRDVPENAAVRMNALLPIRSAARISGWGVDPERWGGDSFYTYLKLREGASIGDVEKVGMDLLRDTPAVEFIEMFDMSLGYRRVDRLREMYDGEVQQARLLMLLAFLVLFIAAMNYVLISLSTLEKRVKSIAVQKCNGARSGGIFGEFLIETALLILVSLVLVGALLFALRGQVESLTAVSLGALFAPAQLIRLGAIVVGFFLLAGVIPGRLFARIPVAHAFKRLKAGKRWWKQAVLFLQLLCATFVLAFLAIVIRQYNFVANRDLGFDGDRVAVADVKNVDRTGYQRLKGELEALPWVEAVANADGVLSDGLSGHPLEMPGTGETVGSRVLEVEPGFIGLMGIEMAAGGDFAPDAGSSVMVVNERLARILGWDATSAVGRMVTDTDGATFEIVGVTRDFHNSGWMSGETQSIHLHANSLPETLEGRGNSVALHVRLSSLDYLEEFRAELERLLPDQEPRVWSYPEMIRGSVSDERMTRNLVTITALVIFVITLAGLVGYVNDEVRRRRREIAIRKINGASVGQIIAIVAGSLVAVGVAALVVGLVGSWIAGGRFLENFPFRTSVAWWSVAAGALVVCAAVGLTVVVRSWRAANENPSITIKSE